VNSNNSGNSTSCEIERKAKGYECEVAIPTSEAGPNSRLYV
jgi:hypothetical protein